GTDLIRWAVAHNRAQSVYCMTGNVNGRAASEIMQAGCVDVLEKPIDVDRLAELIPFQDIMDAGDDGDEPSPAEASGQSSLAARGEAPALQAREEASLEADEPAESFAEWRRRCAS